MIWCSQFTTAVTGIVTDVMCVDVGCAALEDVCAGSVVVACAEEQFAPVAVGWFPVSIATVGAFKSVFAFTKE